MAKRFLVQKTPDSWYLYWCDEAGNPGECVANVYDRQTLELIVKAPAMEQMLRAEGRSLPPEFPKKDSFWGKFQIIMGRYIK